MGYIQAILLCWISKFEFFGMLIHYLRPAIMYMVYFQNGEHKIWHQTQLYSLLRTHDMASYIFWAPFCPPF